VKKISLLLIPFFVALSLSVFTTSLVKSSPGSSLQVVDVSSGTAFSSVEPGGNITVNINVDTDASLFTFQFYLKWNASLLECTSVIEGDFFNEGGAVPTQFTAKIFNATGYIYVANTRLGTYTPGRSGVGTLATVRFLAEAEGGTSLDLYDDPPSQRTLLIDFWGHLVPDVELFDGYYMYPAPAFHVDPEMIVDPDLTSGSTFSIDVNVTDAANLYGFEFKLNYDTTLLTATDVELVLFLNEPTYNTTTIDNDAGYVMINVTSQSPAAPRSGSGVIASIDFSVEGEGGGDFSFSDSRMVDSLGVELLHTDFGGSFSNQKIVSDISMTLAKTTIAVGEGVTISGSITPSKVGVTVTIRYRLAGGSWETLGTTTTDSNSQYSHTWTPTQAGTYEIQASWAGDTTTGSDQSSIYTLKVEASSPPNILLYAGIGAAVVVVVVVLLYFLKFRKSKS